MDSNLSEISGALEQFYLQLVDLVPNLIISLIIFIASLYLAGWISRVISRWLKSRDTDPELALLLETVVRWSLYVLGTTMALNQVGFDLTAFLTGLGILGFTVGFAIQDVSKNFIAGLLLLIEQPFDIGDAIEVQGYGGVVLDVDLRATELRTFDGRIVQIPNSDIFTSAIVNYSRATRRRISLNAGVAYKTDLSRAREAALEAISRVDGVLDDPAPALVYDSFGGSSIDFTLYYWIDTGDTDFFTAQDEGLVAVNRAFKEAGIEIPYPTRVVLKGDPAA